VAALQAAAAQLFVEKGFDATTMTEIAARAGASIGSLYLFFPTKQVLAQTILAELADDVSERLDGLQAATKGWTATRIADAVFDELSRFLTEHPEYAVLIDVRGDNSRHLAVRLRRRSQIAALFAQAEPKLPAGQPERLAVIVPELMRFNMVLTADGALAGREAMIAELRAMLRHHLERSAE
jgi:AcrR family transcriptional regulator